MTICPRDFEILHVVNTHKPVQIINIIVIVVETYFKDLRIYTKNWLLNISNSNSFKAVDKNAYYSIL